MRRFSANYVFPVSQPPIKNGIIEVDDFGRVVRIIEPGDDFREIHSTEFHNGVIVPGFVNAHCHLELSHLKGQFPVGLGIPGFIKAVSEHRSVDEDCIEQSIERAVRELEFSGTVAVGDICNTSDTLFAKSRSKIHFHNFIEVFGINPTSSDKIFDSAIRVKHNFCKVFSTSTSLTPHSTYSLSKSLWDKVRSEIDGVDYPVSIHYAESLPEYEFLEAGTGLLLDHYKTLNIPFDIPINQSPIDVVTNNIGIYKNILLIHNTFASIAELLEINKYYRNATFVTCPESNLFIEGELPDVYSMHQNGLRIAIGTDSLASATTLKMIYHINLLLEKFPDIQFLEILKWATMNGAEALNISDIFGSIEIGKTPGLNLISNFDFNKMCPKINSEVKRLI